MRLDLKMIREIAGLTTGDMATKLGLSSHIQARKAELRPDWLMSSVAKWVWAAGGTCELIVRLPGQELRFTLD